MGVRMYFRVSNLLTLLVLFARHSLFVCLVFSFHLKVSLVDVHLICGVSFLLRWGGLYRPVFIQDCSFLFARIAPFRALFLQNKEKRYMKTTGHLKMHLKVFLEINSRF